MSQGSMGNGKAARAARHGHAVVIGAGIAGLLTARVLADCFDQVTLIERDTLTGLAAHRPGVPQDRHVHGLLARGGLVIEELFPGIGRELAEEGAPIIDFCRDLHFQLPAGAPARTTSGIIAQPASRPFFEAVLRRRVVGLEQVEVRDGCRVTGLLTAPDRSRITGIRYRPTRHAQDDVAETALPADFVVDAGGRSSKVPAWLAELGYPQPREEEVDAGISYASRILRPTPDSPDDFVGIFEPIVGPDPGRGCVVTSIENHQILITLQFLHQRPPRTDAEYTAFMESVRSDPISATSGYDAAAEIHHYSRTTSRRVRHRLRDWPDRLICVGDAVCCFNPVYGQGMTVAAIQAASLRDHLAGRRDLTGFARQHQRRLARLARGPWLLASTADRALQDGSTAPFAVRASNWYLTRVQELIPTQPAAFLRFARVMNMVASPVALAHPSILLRIAYRALGRRGKPD
jgi:2-polyprenyl-6-methoxyphenol hydroxylase-like FAD-dependent oxidoreductase